MRERTIMSRADITEDLDRITQARHYDPFAVLGRHIVGEHLTVRAYLPAAGEAAIAEGNLPMRRLSDDSGLFEWEGEPGSVPLPLP